MKLEFLKIHADIDSALLSFSFRKPIKEFEGFEPTMDQDELRAGNEMEARPATENVEEPKPAKDGLLLNLNKDFKDLTSKLNTVDSKLKEVSFLLL